MTNSAANTRSRLSARAFKEMGAGWYRKTFRADPSWKGRRVLLDFEGIMLTGDVYFNGSRVGGTDYGYLGFEADITPLIDFDGDNIVAVRADTGKPENSRWYTGGGLYRNVNLIVTDPGLHFTRHPSASPPPMSATAVHQWSSTPNSPTPSRTTRKSVFSQKSPTPTDRPSAPAPPPSPSTAVSAPTNTASTACA